MSVASVSGTTYDTPYSVTTTSPTIAEHTVAVETVSGGETSLRSMASGGAQSIFGFCRILDATKNADEIAQPTARVLQTGGHTLSNSTVKQLGLSKDQAKGALETLKKENLIPNSAHGKIMDNGDYVIDGQIVDNLKNYIK